MVFEKKMKGYVKDFIYEKEEPDIKHGAAKTKDQHED